MSELDDILQHWGMPGMKWKKHKKKTDDEKEKVLNNFKASIKHLIKTIKAAKKKASTVIKKAKPKKNKKVVKKKKHSEGKKKKPKVKKDKRKKAKGLLKKHGRKSPKPKVKKDKHKNAKALLKKHGGKPKGKVNDKTQKQPSSKSQGKINTTKYSSFKKSGKQLKTQGFKDIRRDEFLKKKGWTTLSKL